MNSKSALGFVVVGILMMAVPTLLPSWFPHSGPDASNAGSTWLLCMGVVEISIGAYYLVRHSLFPALKRMGAQRAQVRRSRVAWRTARDSISGN
ncbi:MAG TPA: hypothetical protein VGL42_07910 [Opitutaceae bacterium]|jgi:hypothetical protein